MTEAPGERYGAPGSDEPPQDNPTDPELDVEGPNESAPGREPSEGEAEGRGEPARPAPER